MPQIHGVYKNKVPKVPTNSACTYEIRITKMTLIHVCLIWRRRADQNGAEQNLDFAEQSLQFYLILWRYRYRVYRTNQHCTGTDNYRHSNGQRLRVYWLYWGDR